jgi:hypothetical protein
LPIDAGTRDWHMVAENVEYAASFKSGDIVVVKSIGG